MRKYKAKANKHNIKPVGAIFELPRLRFNVKEIEFDFYFSENARYILPSPDHLDWNKGFGLSFSLLSNHRNSLMWAFRWHEPTQRMQLISYCHDVNGERIKGIIDAEHPAGRDEPMISIPLGIEGKTKFKVKLYGDHYYMQFISANKVSDWAVVPAGKSIGKLTRDITAWFGGNLKSPKDFSLYSEIIRIK